MEQSSDMSTPDEMFNMGLQWSFLVLAVRGGSVHTKRKDSHTIYDQWTCPRPRVGFYACVFSMPASMRPSITQCLVYSTVISTVS